MVIFFIILKKVFLRLLCLKSIFFSCILPVDLKKGHIAIMECFSNVPNLVY